MSAASAPLRLGAPEISINSESGEIKSVNLVPENCTAETDGPKNEEQHLPVRGNVKALTQRFEEKRQKVVQSATLPLPRKLRCPTTPCDSSSSSGSSGPKRRVSSKLSGSAGGKVGAKPAVALYKNRAGISRRKSGVLKKASSAQDVRNKRSPAPEVFPKSKSAQERLANSGNFLEVKHHSESSDMERFAPPIRASTPSRKSMEQTDIFDISRLKAKKPKPKTPPKPAFLVLDRKTKTVSLSPEYAEYDSTFSSAKIDNRRATDPDDSQLLDEISSLMTLRGADLDISGHIYGCCLNSSCSGSCSTCSGRGGGGNNTTLTSESGEFSSMLADEKLHSGRISAMEKTPQPSAQVQTRWPTNGGCPPPICGKIKGGIMPDENDGYGEKRDVSPDSERYAKMAEEIFEVEEQRMRNRGEGGSMSSTSWETGSSISSQSTGEKGAKLIGFKSLSVQKEEPTNFTMAEEITPQATMDFRAKKMSQSLYQDAILTSTDSSETDQKVAKRKISKSLAKKLRPLSQPSIDMDRLLRIKSDIRLNLAKQVGKIKLRVTSAPATENLDDRKSASRKKRAKSTFYVTKTSGGDEKSATADGNGNFSESTNSESPEPHGVKGTIEFELVNEQEDCDSDHVFDDDWSDTEDDNSETSEPPDLGSSTTCLPDVVPSVSTVPEAPTTSTAPPQLLAQRQISDAEDNYTEFVEEGNDKTDVTPVATLERDSVSPLQLDSLGIICKLGQDLKHHLSKFSSKKELEMTRSDSIDQHTEGGSAWLEHLQPTYSSRFVENQPLYQHYQQESDLQALRVARNESMSSTDTPEEAESSIGAPTSTLSLSVTGSGRWCERRQRLIASSNFGSQRSLWCELPEVKRAGLLDALGNQEKKLQEAMFEVITSEASYLRSLNILITHFMAAAQLTGKQNLQSVICAQDRKNLFSNILKVRDCSESLLSSLEANFEEDMKLEDICGLLAAHFKQDFDVYVKYCSNQVYQDRTLRGLKINNAKFLLVLQELEANPMCEGLDMRSFLMLPMQRITRYPLLVDAIYTRTTEGTERHQNAARALALANKVVRKCNDGARKMERMEQLLEIDRRLIYRNGDGLRKIPLVSSGRYLLKKEELTQLRRSPDRYSTIRKGSLSAIASASPGRKKLKRQHLFLFTDLLMVAKKQKTNDNFVVRDYCARQFVEVTPLEASSSQVPQGALAALGTFRTPHLFLITLMQNAKGKQTDLVLCTDSETERARWVEALSPPPQPTNPDEAVYSDWDCPQVQAIHQYVPTQEDELRLEVGDVVNLQRKMKDGWMEGERQRDGSRGWFPRTYVVEILSDHVRARNYRQRLRLIQAAESLQRDQSAKRLKDFAAPMANEELVMTRNGGRRSTTSGALRNQLRRLSNPKMLFQV